MPRTTARRITTWRSRAACGTNRARRPIGRTARKGQPFFAVFNHTITHESQIRNEIDESDRIHDPAKVRLPAYHPDTPEVRRDWAQYYDRITMMDTQAGAKLEELEQAGLADDTIVFFFSDHGSGMPRSKRSACNSGLNVPFIVYFPPKWRHLAPKDYRSGGTSDRLISFVDLAPTMLSLAGIKPPEWMQGGAFCGKYESPEPEFSFGFRGRMDERYDLVRSVRDKRYMYIRNYMPHRPRGPARGVHVRHADDARLAAAVRRQENSTRPNRNSGNRSPSKNSTISKRIPMKWTILRIRRSIGTVASPHARGFASVGKPDQGRRLTFRVGNALSVEGHNAVRNGARPADNTTSMPFSRPLIWRPHLMPHDLPKIVQLLKNKDSAVRYWGAIGLLTQAKEGVKSGHDALVAALARRFADGADHGRRGTRTFWQR